MHRFLFCLVAQLLPAFGLTGVVWPDKRMPWFGVLLFPCSANHRLIRANGAAAIGIAVGPLAKLFIAGL